MGWAGRAGCSQAARNRHLGNRSNLAAYLRRVPQWDMARSRVARGVRCQTGADWRQSRDSWDEGAVVGDREQKQQQDQQ